MADKKKTIPEIVDDWMFRCWHTSKPSLEIRQDLIRLLRKFKRSNNEL